MKQNLFTKLFWMDAAERMVVTFAQVVLSVLTVLVPAYSAETSLGMDVALADVLSKLPIILLAGLMGSAISLLKAIAAAYKAGSDTASLTVDTKELK